MTFARSQSSLHPTRVNVKNPVYTGKERASEQACVSDLPVPLNVGLIRAAAAAQGPIGLINLWRIPPRLHSRSTVGFLAELL